MSDRRPSDPVLAGAAATPIALADPARAPLNVLAVGVGGQGVIMVSKLIALLAQQQGYDVKQSEVHGMAKRGGAVFSHVRFGRQVWSPTIPKGEVDILIALEWAEGLRWLTHLKPETGIFICDTKRIVPPFACRDRRPGAAMRYVHETQAEVIAHVAEGYAIDATGMAEELGNERAANILLLGALSAALHFPVADWEHVVTQFVPKKTVAVNIEAFRRGRRWIEQARAGLLPAETSEARAPAADTPYRVRLEITPAWCKSCDICVKLCPERCLRLNAERIVELAEPDKCTGCRLCEWLCPDFAIRVHLDRASISRRARSPRDERRRYRADREKRPEADFGQHRLCARGDRRRLPLLRRLSDHSVFGDRGTSGPPAAGGRRRFCADGRRDRLDGGRDRRLHGRRQGDDRDQRSGIFAQAGKHRLRGGCRNSLRDRQRHARRPLDRHADAAGASRCDAGALGQSWRLSDHRADAGIGARDLRRDHSRLRPGGELPVSRRGALRPGARAALRDRRARYRARCRARGTHLGERSARGLPALRRRRSGHSRDVMSRRWLSHAHDRI